MGFYNQIYSSGRLSRVCVLILLFSIISICATNRGVNAEESSDDKEDLRLIDFTFGLFEKCGNKDFVLCFKEKAVRFIDGIPGDYEISEGIRLMRTTSSTVNSVSTAPDQDAPASLRSVPASLESIDKLPLAEQEQAVDTLLVDRLSRLLSSYTIQLRMPDSAVNEVRRSLEEEGRRKKKKYLMPILLLLKLKAVTLLPIILGTLALLAFKALLLGKLALLISGLIALKKLLSQHHSETYEVVAHPHHTYSSTYDEHGHYARSIADETPLKSSQDFAQKLAYNSRISESKPESQTN